MKNDQKFQEYHSKITEMSHLSSIASVLAWDQQVMAPAGSHRFRGKQLSSLSRHLHRLAVSKEFGKLIDELHARGPESFDDFQWRSLEESRIGYQESTKLSEDLVARCAELGVIGQETWYEAKTSDNFKLYQPILEEWIEIKKKIASLLYPNKSPFDVCLDSFERGLNQKIVDSIFEPTKKGLLELQEAIWKSPKKIRSISSGPYPIESQKKLNEYVADWLGFSFEHGRLDESAHPFSISFHRSDVRMTTRYEKSSFVSALLSSVHETGHSLYEQGLPGGEYESLPAASALGLVVHESQSLLFERRVGQSLHFWNHLRPELIKLFPFLDTYSAQELYEYSNQVAPCQIRIDADEVTYVMHIILRYELEKKLFDGELKVSELPDAWNEASKDLLFLTPESDSKGVLQDSHWSDGAFGYFPVYTLGAMYGSQLFDAARSQLSDLDSEMNAGIYSSLLGWLRTNIHQRGRVSLAFELLQEVSGSGLDPQIYLDYLWGKYASIYNIQRPDKIQETGANLMASPI